MNKRNCSIIFLLIFALLLTGCGPSIPTYPGISTDEARARMVINEYFLAISNQNWNKARSYCVSGGTMYYTTSQMESSINSYRSYCSVVTINAYPKIISSRVYGNYAEVYFYLSLTVSTCGYFDSDGTYITYGLQRVGSSWKIL